MPAHYNEKKTLPPYFSIFNIKFIWYKLKRKIFYCYWREGFFLLLMIYIILISANYSDKHHYLVDSILIPIASTIIISIVFYVFVNKRGDRQKLQVLKKTFADILHGHAGELFWLLVQANLFEDNAVAFNSLENTKGIFESIRSHPQEEDFIYPPINFINARNKNIEKSLKLIYVIPNEITQCLWGLLESEYSFWLLTFLKDRKWSDSFLSLSFTNQATNFYNDHVLICEIAKFYLQNFKISRAEEDDIKIILYGNLA